MLIAEMGISQVTKGSGPRAFGSLGLASRAVGLNWLMSIGVCLVFSAVSAYSIIFAVESHQHNANYFTARVTSSVSAQRACTKYGSYIRECGYITSV